MKKQKLFNFKIIQNGVALRGKLAGLFLFVRKIIFGAFAAVDRNHFVVTIIQCFANDCRLDDVNARLL